ncbi:unnamed protein product [Brachionus calyciflorus]|uniref:Uncharacterized protein n=1 Tax=Brachionus calyciflorus TaxID=104777 RepID=A0A814I913_9BILA|nr:unnamed protein product [Brachionus calyciflorus]
METAIVAAAGASLAKSNFQELIPTVVSSAGGGLIAGGVVGALGYDEWGGTAGAVSGGVIGGVTNYFSNTKPSSFIEIVIGFGFGAVIGYFSGQKAADNAYALKAKK